MSRRYIDTRTYIRSYVELLIIDICYNIIIVSNFIRVIMSFQRCFKHITIRRIFHVLKNDVSKLIEEMLEALRNTKQKKRKKKNCS